ncbi:MAG: hypothetical protein KAR40_11210 [Candidatus Sabulitectum sp.]|nr:hypothetical protein [Candidatus Sabulitectum sp.]
MSKRILFDNGDGGLAIVIPAPNYVAVLIEANPGYTEQQCMEQIATKDLSPGTEYEVVDEADIPTDRTFRDAWEHDTSAAPEKIKCNITKAIVIAHAMRRVKRDEAFLPHDMVIAAAIPGNTVAEDAANAARDIIRADDAANQITIDATTTEAELKTAVDAIAH